MEKINIRENEYHCLNCYQVFSFQTGEIKVQATKTIIPELVLTLKEAREAAPRSKKVNYDVN
jgi:hypothetical protein